MIVIRQSYTLFQSLGTVATMLLASAMPFSKSALTKDPLVCEAVYHEDVQFRSCILSVDIEEGNEPNNS